jgi:hypothetical protein
MSEYEDYLRNQKGAKAISKYSEKDDLDFWTGYLRGLKGLQKSFADNEYLSSDEHKAWSSANKDRDKGRRLLGVGYQTGFSGMSAGLAVRRLGRYRAGSTAGAAMSPAKGLALAANARVPRTKNMKEVPRPRKKPLVS